MASATGQRPEAKLRELVEPLWDEYIEAKRINLHFQPRNERSLANGRADTVYNRLIMEYKKPGVIKSDNAKNRQLIAQVRGYIDDLAKEERWKEERLLGVAFDGQYFLYIRKVGRWIEDEPLPVDANSVERFLLTLEKLTGNAATKILGRSTSSEIMQPDYRFLDQDLKLSVTRLSKGELLVQHAVFRQPVKIMFPKPAYRQE